MSIDGHFRAIYEREQAGLDDREVRLLLEDRVRQQAAVAWLGQRALAAQDAQTLMDEAAELVVEVLDVELCKVLELLPDQQHLLLRSGVGWTDGLVRRATISAGVDSHSGFTLLANEPVIVNDLRHESRFAQSDLLADHGAVSGISVVIRGQERPFGVLGAYSTQHRSFTNDDSYFLQAVANVLAAAVRRSQIEVALRTSEEQFRSLVEMAPDVIFSLDARDGTLTSLSSAFEQITGWSRDEWIGKSYTGLLHPDDLPAASRRYEEILTGHAPPPYEMRIRTSTGDYRVGEFRTKPKFDGDAVVGVFGIARDVTERNFVEEELRRSRDELAIILRGVADGIIVLDRNGSLIYANDSAAVFLGLNDPDAMLGKSAAQIFRNYAVSSEDGAHVPVFNSPSLRAASGKTVTNEVLRFRRRSDGEEFWSSVSSTPIFDADGSVRYVITIYHDVTERRHEAITQAFLGEVSRMLGATLDIDSALQDVAHGAVPVMADWCIIDRLEPDGSLRRILAAANAASETQAAVIDERFPLDLDSTHPIAQVIRTGTPMLVDRATSFGGAMNDALPPPSAIAQRFGYRSCVIAPIIARGRIFGALTLAQAESGRLFNERGRDLGMELARRVAVGIDNARLFSEAQTAVARVRALSEASRAFSEARLDLQAVLDSVAEHVGKLIGDQCIVRLLSEDGEWLTLAAAYREGADRQAELSHALLEKPQRVNEGIAGRVMTTGQHVLIPHVDLDALKQTVTPAFARHLDENPIYSLAITPLRAHDRLIGSVGVTRERSDAPYTESDLDLLNDLADRAALAIENALLYASAQDAVKVREQFLSIASHELKTPLTSVKAASQLLTRFVRQDPPDVSRIARIVGQLGGEVSRLESLVFDLLDATKIQQGRLDLRPGTVDLEEIVQHVVARFEHDPVHLTSHIVVVDCPDPVIGTWDGDRLDQVLTNLMSNALKYSPQGGEVRFALRCNDDEAVIEVSDHGLGISREDQAQLFQPFSRGEIVRQSIGGTGLGLYISAEIIERHGGSINVRSEPGSGSTFTIHLPLDVTANPGAQDLAETP